MFASSDAENLVFRFPADIDDHLRMLKKDANEVRQKWVTHDNWEYSLFLRLLTPIHDLDIKIPEEGDTDFEETVKIIMDFLAVIRIDDWGVLFFFRNKYTPEMIERIFEFLLRKDGRGGKI